MIKLLFLVLMIVTPVTAYGQNELFMGYSFNWQHGLKLHGFDVAGAGAFNDWASIVVDVTGHYTSPASVYSYRVGPRFAVLRTPRVTQYVQALIGGNYVKAPLAFIGTDDLKSRDLALAVGFGVDARINDHLSYRVFQMDYNLLRVVHVGTHGARITSGIIVKFR